MPTPTTAHRAPRRCARPRPYRRLLAYAALAPLVMLSGGCRDAAGPDPATTAGRPDTVAGNWAAVAVGEDATCALDRAGRAYCWGDNYRGRLAVADTAHRLTEPTPVVGLPALPMRSIAAGGDHQCVLADDGRAFCWGANNGVGELGSGSTSPGPSAPVAVAGGLAFGSISVNLSHTCAVTEDGTAYCWGADAYAQLGAGAAVAPCDYASDPQIRCVAPAPVPVAGGLRFRQVSAGAWHSCGVTDDDRAFCWGSNTSGQLGRPDVPVHCGAFPAIAACFRDAPVPVAGGLRFAQVAAGAFHSCGLTTGGAAYCWGLDTEDATIGATALGNAAYAGPPPGPHGSRVPVPVSGGLTFREIAVGNGESCGLTTGARAVCWGDNNFGQLGVGSTAPGASTRPRAVAMPAAAAAPQLGAADVHVCALGSTGRIWCWGGYNFDGELGSPPLGVPLSLNEVRATPAPVVDAPTH